MIQHSATHIALIATVGLTACGGGGGGSDVPQATVPQFSNSIAAASGPAVTAHSGPAVGIGTTVPLAAILIRDFTSEMATDGSADLILRIAGTDYRLAQDPNTGTYLATTPALNLAVELAVSDEASLMLLVTEDSSAYFGSFHDFGNTISSTAPLSGTSYYIGPAAYVATITGVGGSAGSGGFVFETDFDAALVDGRIALQDLNGTGFNVDFEDAPIHATGFSTSNLQVGGLAGITVVGELQASFYGSDARQVAGTFALERDSDLNMSSDQFLSGGFLGNQQSPAAIEALLNGDPVQVSDGERIVLGSGSVVGGSGSVYPDGSSSYYNSNTGVSFGADGGGCYYVGDWSNC